MSLIRYVMDDKMLPYLIHSTLDICLLFNNVFPFGCLPIISSLAIIFLRTSTITPTDSFSDFPFTSTIASKRYPCCVQTSALGLRPNACNVETTSR